VAGTATEVIKNTLDADITRPRFTSTAEAASGSARVRVTKLRRRAEDDAFMEFKRRLGSLRIPFPGERTGMSPEQLSAEVLKSLRGDVVRTKGEEISAGGPDRAGGVRAPPVRATKRAAELAGFRTSLLLQEPVAAALAYGHQRMNTRAYWLVFDFGGGTFDAALIRSEDGTMVVTNHGGTAFSAVPTSIGRLWSRSSFRR